VLKSNLPRLPTAVRRAISIEQGVRARKAAERAMRGANALLQITEKSAHIGSFDWDVPSGECLWSREVYRIFGRNPGEFTPTLRNFLECVHSDDRARLQDAIDAALTRNQPLNIEFRIVRPDNTERTIHSLDEVFREAGTAYRMTGTVHDITEQRRAEDTNREDEARFRSLVEQNVAGIIIVRDDSTIGYVNPLYAKWIGYPVADLIGRPILDLVADADKEDVREKLRRQLASSGDFLQFELTVQASDGHPIDFLINASRSIFEGRPASIVFLLDVTERKAAETSLHRLNRTLRTLSRGNEALVHAASEAELLSEMCHIIVATGVYRMAWVGVPQHDAAKSVTPCRPGWHRRRILRGPAVA
jgi:PAS domain S-box-containing protein